MKTLHKISFSLLIFVFTAFFVGQGLASCSVIEKVKTENTSDYTGIFTNCNSECPGEEDVSFFVQPVPGQSLVDLCQDLKLPFFNLPPVIYYPVWLPPDNS
jgi:hypothetical protein